MQIKIKERERLTKIQNKDQKKEELYNKTQNKK